MGEWQFYAYFEICGRERLVDFRILNLYRKRVFTLCWLMLLCKVESFIYRLEAHMHLFHRPALSSSLWSYSQTQKMENACPSSWCTVSLLPCCMTCIKLMHLTIGLWMKLESPPKILLFTLYFVFNLNFLKALLMLKWYYVLSKTVVLTQCLFSLLYPSSNEV